MTLYRLGKVFFRLIFAVVFRWDVRGREHEPATGPLLVCANHLSWWDPPLVGCVLSRPVFFMAKAELFDYPVLGRLLPRVGAFPVRRGRPDRQALRRAAELLDQGRVVGMFVEGTRRHGGELGEARPGAAWLAIRCQAPVLPILIEGPYRLGQPIRVRIGAPFELSEYYGRKVDPEELTIAGQQIMERIAALRRQEVLSTGLKADTYPPG